MSGMNVQRFLHLYFSGFEFTEIPQFRTIV